MGVLAIVLAVLATVAEGGWQVACIVVSLILAVLCLVGGE